VVAVQDSAEANDRPDRRAGLDEAGPQIGGKSGQRYRASLNQLANWSSHNEAFATSNRSTLTWCGRPTTASLGDYHRRARS
jgi:hypothetical protein